MVGKTVTCRRSRESFMRPTKQAIIPHYIYHVPVQRIHLTVITILLSDVSDDVFRAHTTITLSPDDDASDNSVLAVVTLKNHVTNQIKRPSIV